MPRVDKTAFTNFAATSCQKQLRIGLHPDSNAYQSERDALNLPHRQIRPQLRHIEEEGERWGEAKVWDLVQAFGSDHVRGGASTRTGTATQPGLKFAESELSLHLGQGVQPGDFLIEVEFDAGTDAFKRIHRLEQVSLGDTLAPLDFRRVRPDIIQVQGAGAGSLVVTAEGEVRPVTEADPPLLLRIIDVKLTSEPGPRYFAELAFYSLALAAWLVETRQTNQFAVAATPAVWPGSERLSVLQEAPTSGEDPYDALDSTLRTVPIRTFVAEARRLLRIEIPKVLAAPFPELPWAVGPRCQGCENLGQRFQEEPGDQASDWDPRHCIPTALETHDLSRLPFLSKGSVRVLRARGRGDVPAVAGMEADDPTFDEHHRLRGQRGVISERARALSGEAPPALHPDASTSAIPRSAQLRLYLTADFDPGSAITLAFGFTWAWLEQGWQPSSVSRLRMHHSAQKTPEAEWIALSSLLEDMTAIIDEVTRHSPEATIQVYVWDRLTFDHITRVVSRHLAQVLDQSSLKRLVWLFPPSEIIGNPRLTSTAAVSIVKEAARSLLSLNVPHVYSLLETARQFHRVDHPNPAFEVRTFWEDPFSDQIPPERAHQVWRGQRSPNAPTPAQLLSILQNTVRTKLTALSSVVDHLTAELSGRLPRESPKVSSLKAPEDLAASSHLGALVYAHARLDAALQSLKVQQTRALPIAEREARFESARVVRLLNQADSATELERMALTNPSHRYVYELAPGSTEVKAGDNSMNWVLAPETLTPQLGWSVSRFLNNLGDHELVNSWSNQNGPLYRSLADLLAVNVVRVERSRRLIVVDRTNYNDAASYVQVLIARGHLDLSQDLVLDPTAVDYFTSPLGRAIRSIGNPPLAQLDARMQAAIGSSRRPRRSAAHAAESFIWRPEDMADATVARDTPALREMLECRGRRLNESQWEAWEESLTRRLTLIWGPPGTGKTASLQSILESLVDSANGAALRIAVCAGTYTAIDNVLQGFSERMLEVHPELAIRRLRSEGRSTPGWLRDGQDVQAKSPEFNDLSNELGQPDRTIVIAGAPQQLIKLIEASTGESAGPVFDVLIIDEAGAVDVAHALLAIGGLADGASLILAGDPKQLPPIHQSVPPTDLEWAVGSIYNYFSVGNNIGSKDLLVNYRSNAEIVELSRRAGYPALLQSNSPDLRLIYAPSPNGPREAGGVPPVWPRDLVYSGAVEELAAPARPATCFIYPEGLSGQWNPFEASLVVGLVCWYHQALIGGVGVTGAPVNEEYFWRQSIGIVTPHRAQRAKIVAQLVDLFAPGGPPEVTSWIEAAVDTVERFQGQERDVIIGSYAVGDPDTIAEEAEFLLNLNRFNVLSTRPRAKLIVVASRELIAHIDSNLDIIESSELVKDFVELYCAQTMNTTFEHVVDGQPVGVPGEVRWA